MAAPPVLQSELSNGHSSAGTGPIHTAVAALRRRNPVSDDFALCIEWNGQCRNIDMRPLPNPKNVRNRSDPAALLRGNRIAPDWPGSCKSYAIGKFTTLRVASGSSAAPIVDTRKGVPERRSELGSALENIVLCPYPG